MSDGENDSENNDEGQYREVDIFLSKFQVKSSDMSEEMIENVNDVLKNGFEQCEFHRYDSDRQSELAELVKREMDKRYQPSWHCIVGEKFGTFVTHSKGNFIYLSLEKKGYNEKNINIVLFKT